MVRSRTRKRTVAGRKTVRRTTRQGVCMHTVQISCRRSTWSARLLLIALLAVFAFGHTPAIAAQVASAPPPATLQPGVLPAAQVEKLLPPSVYFNGQSAPLQLRNAAALRSASGTIAWMSLVDTSGYSTGVREKYQFYLVAEGPLQFGDATLPAGAYGGGFLTDGTAVLLDLGAHEIRRTPAITDPEMHRPRPLQLVAAGPAYRLYLGRQYVAIAFKP